MVLSKRVNFFNRVVRFTSAGVEVECDPRHAELVIEQLGLEGRRGLSTPGIDALDDFDLEKPEDELSEGEKTSYRAIAARMNYMAMDRPDITYSVKEACRDMANPVRSSWKKLSNWRCYRQS